MANAGMKTTGAKAIAAALCANNTLEALDLSGNYFGCKADDNAWESAADLLSFGLQARVKQTLRHDAVGNGLSPNHVVQQKLATIIILVHRIGHKTIARKPLRVNLRDV